MASNPFFTEEILKYMFTASAMATRPSAWYVALHTGDPGTGADNELADANYVRQVGAFEVVPDGSTHISRNTADLVFPALAAGATVAWVTVKTASTAGTHIKSVQLPVPKTYTAGQVPRTAR